MLGLLWRFILSLNIFLSGVITPRFNTANSPNSHDLELVLSLLFITFCFSAVTQFCIQIYRIWGSRSCGYEDIIFVNIISCSLLKVKSTFRRKMSLPSSVSNNEPKFCSVPASFWVFAWLILWLWKWRWHVPRKRRFNFQRTTWRYNPQDRTLLYIYFPPFLRASEQPFKQKFYMHSLSPFFLFLYFSIIWTLGRIILHLMVDNEFSSESINALRLFCGLPRFRRHFVL
jgi:hypothetical protein